MVWLSRQYTKKATRPLVVLGDLLYGLYGVFVMERCGW